MEGTFVATSLRVGVWRIENAVSGLAIGCVVTVRAIDGIEEVVEEAIVSVVVFVVVVVSLEENGILRVDDWVRNLEI